MATLSNPLAEIQTKFKFVFPLLLIPVFLLSIVSCDLGGDQSLASFDGPWLIPQGEVISGGPPIDGIPSIDNPKFAPAGETTFIPDNRLVVGVNIDGEVRAYPHQQLDSHEIVNDRIGNQSFALIYCPLTGTGTSWNREINGEVTEFGVSGLLFRNNVIPYDRNSFSAWSQMQLRGVNGDFSGFNAETYQVIETTWETWKQLFPDSQVLTTDTGFNRNYSGSFFVYGDYATNHNAFVFSPAITDNRRLNKERAHGIIDSATADANAVVKVYVIEEFGDGINLVEDRVGNNNYLIAGSRDYNLAAAFQISSVSLQFEAVQGELPVIMKDNEGNLWDVFGYAVEGPRTGERLTAANSYTGYWFAWANHFSEVDIFDFDG